MKILVAEDNGIAARFLCRTLEAAGHCVAAVDNGLAAWEYLRENPVDILISDWMMPGMDGLELCRRLRAQSGAVYTYVILLTARDRRVDRMEGMQAGADDFLVKPLDVDELAARLDVGQRILAMQEKLQNRSQELADAITYLEVANRRFSELYMGLPVACITCDAQGRIQEWNRASEVLFGASMQNAYQKRLWETIYPAEEQQEALQAIGQVFAGEHIESEEWSYFHPDGTLRYLLCHRFPLRGSGDEITGIISTHVDITARKQDEQKIREYSAELERQQEILMALATIDGLTNVKNHRAFQDHLRAECERSARYRNPLSLLLIDVDNFKRYNDSYGHPAGDEVLKTLAGLLEQHARETDFVARYGGEEFVVVLSNTDAPGAITVAERLRTAITAFSWPRGPVTASFGVATYRPDMRSSHEMIEAADRGLYRSKQAGRNRISCGDSQTHAPMEAA